MASAGPGFASHLSIRPRIHQSRLSFKPNIRSFPFDGSVSCSGIDHIDHFCKFSDCRSTAAVSDWVSAARRLFQTALPCRPTVSVCPAFHWSFGQRLNQSSVRQIVDEPPRDLQHGETESSLLPIPNPPPIFCRSLSHTPSDGNTGAFLLPHLCRAAPSSGREKTAGRQMSPGSGGRTPE